jgi:predicted RNA-binding protein Jag
MQDTMTPVAPPDMSNPQPVGGAIAPVAAKTFDVASMYEDAAANGDPASMYSLTSRVKGTELEPVVKRSAEIMQKNLDEFQKEIKPVMDKGGPGTPEGRIATAKTIDYMADKPQKMRAFVEMLIGNPNWRLFVTGGTEKKQLIYDNQGNPIEKTVNELGNTLKAVDANTGQQLTREEVAARGGFVPSLQEAIGYKTKVQQAQFNTEAFNKANQATADYSSKAPELKELYGELGQRLKNLGEVELTEAQRQAIGTFTTRSLGYSQTVSDGLNALRQKVDNKNVSLSEAQQKSLSAVLEKMGFRVGADGSVVNKTGEAVTKNELDQAQKSLTNGTQFDRNFTQSKEDFIRSEVFKGLGAGDMKNIGRILDLQQMAERTQLELSSKHGNLPFLINPKSYQLGDEFVRGEALALIGEFNQDATQAFSDWRKTQLAKYKDKSQVPSAGELESAFSRTEAFRDLRQQFAERNREILRRPVRSRPETGQTAADYSVTLGLGESPKEQPASIRGRSIKNPEIKSEPKPERKTQDKPKTPSIRDLASQFGGRK